MSAANLMEYVSTRQNVRQTLSVTLVSDLNTFAALGDEWDALLAESGLQNLALTHGWLMSWLVNFAPQRLLVILVRDESGKLVAAAPFKVSKGATGLFHRALSHLQFIGTQPTVFDWIQIPIASSVDSGQVLDLIADRLLQESWDVLDLPFGLDRDQWQALSHRLAPAVKQVSILESSIIPYTPLPSDVETFEAGLRTKFKREIRRRLNKLERDFPDQPLKLVMQQSSLETGAHLDRFIENHSEYWAGRGSRSDFVRFPALAGFYKSMLALDYPDSKAPHLEFSVLKLGETPISYCVSLWQGDRLLTHLNSYSQEYKPYGPGLVHMHLLIKEMIHRGAVEFEFGRGDEPYKQNWTQDAYPPKPLWQLLAFRSPLALALWQADLLLKKLLRKG